MSRNNNPVFTGFYKFLYKPEKGSVSDFLNKYSLKKRIYVLQIGANDGFNHDPVHKFIKRDKWRGILIEPQKYVFDKYLSKLYENTNDIITLNAALGEKDGVQPVYKISFTNDRWASGSTTFYKENLQGKVDNGTITRLAVKNGIIPPDSPDDFIVEEFVDIVSPKTLKEKYNIKELDVLMIDTEGYDFEIIKMITNVGLLPEVILFEHSHLSEEDAGICQLFLKEKGYAFRMISANTLAVKRDSDAFGIFTKLFRSNLEIFYPGKTSDIYPQPFHN